MSDHDTIANQAEQDQLWAGVVEKFEDQYLLVMQITDTITTGDTAEKLRNASDDVLNAVATLASIAMSEVGTRIIAAINEADSP